MNIPHNAQEHNSKRSFLRQLTYQQGESVTCYDSINSLTHHNNHYTLLYPDLVQELFDLSLHKSNINTNLSRSLGGLACGTSPSSSLGSSLHPREILFFLQIVSLYQLELSKGNSAIVYSALKLAKLLGFDSCCDENISSLKASNMRSTILKMTSKLESMGLLKVFRSKRSNGINKVNKIAPVLPDKVYENIRGTSDNLTVSNNSKLYNKSNIDHILKTKLFVPIELQFMKHLFKDNLPAKYKLFFLNCIITAYRNFKQGNSFSFSSTSRELMKKNNISKGTLFNIFKYIKQQEEQFFIRVEHTYTKSDDLDSNRYDKSIFVISIAPLVFPTSYINSSQKEENTDIHYDDLHSADPSFFPDTYEDIGEGVQKKPPSSAKKTAHNNKDIMIKNSIIENIDYIDAKKEFLENEQSSFPSESYNNSFKSSIYAKQSYSNTTSESAISIIKNISEYKELRYFYPLSEKDVDTLNFRAKREFSNNFMNQLLLKLYIKYPEKRFKNKFTFLSYMEKILKNEKHQGPLVNHTSFRFSCNIGTIEKGLLKYEKYLSQIENSFDTSKAMQIKKKIAGRFSTELAYKILTMVEFKTNYDNSFITALIPNRLDLSEQQIATLSEQLEAVYGINGYYVKVFEDVGYAKDTREKGERKESIENQYSKIKEPDIISNSKDIGILESSKELDTIEENTAWNQIRKGLIEELGEVVDEVWFSKAEARECKEAGLLTLTMPTRFMSDWVRNNYFHVIRILSERCGVKMVEYGYV